MSAFACPSTEYVKGLTKVKEKMIKMQKNITKQYWDMVSLLVAVLNHNNLVETEHQDDISFYTEQVYRQLQKNYPEYGITEEEIENVSHLAPIHDIAFYGAQRSPFRFRTAAFRNETVVYTTVFIQVNGKG